MPEGYSITSGRSTQIQPKLLVAVQHDFSDPTLESGYPFHLRMPGMVHAAIAASSVWADEVALRTLPVGLRQSLLIWTAAEAEEFLARMPSVVAAVAAFNDRRDLAREDWTRIKFLAADSTTWKHEAIALAEARLSQPRLATHPSAPARQRRLA